MSNDQSRRYRGSQTRREHSVPATALWLSLPLAVFVGFGVLLMQGSDVLPARIVQLLPQSPRWLAIAAGSALWLSGAWLVARLLEVFLWQGIVRPLLGRAVPGLLRQSLLIVVYGIAITGIIGAVLNQSVTGIWATSGVIGIVLGFGLQRTIGDIFTGLAVNIDQAYRIGDWIEILDKNYPHIYGQIHEVHWRATRIRTIDGKEIIVPNSVLGGMVFANYSLPDDICRFEFPVVTDVRVPTDDVLRILDAAALAACRTGSIVEEPHPTVVVSGPVPAGIEYIVRYWIRVSEVVPTTARHIVAKAVLHHLAIAGIETVDTTKLDVIHMPEAVAHDPRKDARIRLLEGVDLFSDALNHDEMASLAAAMHIRRFDAGDIIVREGEPGRSLFVIAEGIVDVTVKSGEEALRLAVIEAGEFVGEMSLLTGEPRSATVTARTAVLAYEITDADLAPVLSSRAELFRALSRIAADRRLGRHHGNGSTDADDSIEAQGLSQQILSRMSAFFRQLGSKRSAAN